MASPDYQHLSELGLRAKNALWANDTEALEAIVQEGLDPCMWLALHPEPLLRWGLQQSALDAVAFLLERGAPLLCKKSKEWSHSAHMDILATQLFERDMDDRMLGVARQLMERFRTMGEVAAPGIYWYRVEHANDAGRRHPLRYLRAIDVLMENAIRMQDKTLVERGVYAILVFLSLDSSIEQKAGRDGLGHVWRALGEAMHAYPDLRRKGYRYQDRGEPWPMDDWITGHLRWGLAEMDRYAMEKGMPGRERRRQSRM